MIRSSAADTWLPSLTLSRTLCAPGGAADIRVATPTGQYGQVPSPPARAANSATERNPVPEADAYRLLELQEQVQARSPGARAALDLLIAQIVRRGYTLEAVGLVLDVSREAVRQRTLRVSDSALVGIEPEVSKLLERPDVVRPVKPSLTEDELADLERLRPLASTRNGGNRNDPLVAAAGSEFNSILLHARDRGVTAYSMAKALGVTPAAITFRLERETGNLPPSLAPKAVADRRRTLPDNVLPAVQRLLEIGPLAASASARSRPGDAAYDASREFDQILVDLIDGLDVSASAIARGLDRGTSGLLARLYKARDTGVVPRDNLPDALTAVLPTDSSAASGVPAVDPALSSVADRDAGPTGTSTGTLPDDDLGNEEQVDREFDPEFDLDTTDAAIPDGGGPAVPVSDGVAGSLADFSPATTPSGPTTAPESFNVDPRLRDQRTAEHHDAVRRLRQAATDRGLSTLAWAVGQDAAFVWNSRLVNVEVKTVNTVDSTGRYRLGIGQLQEQVQHHLANAEAGEQWYRVSGVSSVLPLLVIDPPQPIPAVWIALARRLDMLVLHIDAAVDLIAHANDGAVPSGVPLPAPST